MSEHLQIQLDRIRVMCRKAVPATESMDTVRSVDMALESLQADVARLRAALEQVDAYFAACAKAWLANDGKMIDANGTPLTNAVGLDEMCDRAATATSKALESTDVD